MPEIQIEAFTTTSLLITAGVCIVAVLAAYYTMRGRIQLSQIILGIFCYVMVRMLESIFDMAASTAGLNMEGLSYGLYMIVSVVLARELVRFAGLRYGVQGNFDSTDAAVGFAIGFAGAYLFVCGAYYFNCYTTASEYVSSGADAFFVNAGENAQEARELLDMIARQSGWQFIVTGVNRVFYLVREIALTVLLWYAMREDGKKLYFLLVPLMHLAAMVPDGLFQAGILENSYGKDAVTCVISAGIAFLAARQYNAKEDLVAHFQVEKLRARRRK